MPSPKRIPTLLCIDDDTCWMAQFASLLQTNGYSVLTASDLDTALDLLHNNLIDALVLDCHAACASTELVARLKSLWPRVPIVKVSGHCPRRCGHAAEADACFEKGGSKTSALFQIARLARPETDPLGARWWAA